jgi:hypothetical protein
MSDINLSGYGPHVLAAGNDYYLQCVRGNPSKNKQLTIGIDISAGSITVMSRESDIGAGQALETQSYKKSDETLAAAAIAADATVRVDATAKDVVLRTAALTVATVMCHVDTEA